MPGIAGPMGRALRTTTNRLPTATAAEPTTPTGSIGEIVQVRSQTTPKMAVIVPYQAPIGPGVFRGRVVDAATREPIREFTVEFHQPRRPPGPEPAPVSRSFRTQDGRFEHRGLPELTGNIFTTASGYQRFDMIDVRAPLENESSAKEILIPMRAGQVLRGRVIDEITKDPIASALISFREASVGRYQGNFRTRPSVRSAKDGAFVLDGVPPGAVSIEAWAQNYATKEIEILVGAETPPVEVTLSKGGTVAGYLADAGRAHSGRRRDQPGQPRRQRQRRRRRPAAPASFRSANSRPVAIYWPGTASGLSGQQEIEVSHNERREDIVLAMRAGPQCSRRGFRVAARKNAPPHIAVPLRGGRSHRPCSQPRLSMSEAPMKCEASQRAQYEFRSMPAYAA